MEVNSVCESVEDSTEWQNGGAPPGRRSPNVVQYGPNTRQNGGAGPTKDQHETTPFTTPLNLQNLHPRFKSGRRLQPSLGSIPETWVTLIPETWVTVSNRTDYRSVRAGTSRRRSSPGRTP